MSIKLHELKKVITSPVVIGLTVVFIAFNIFSIFNSTYFNDELKVLNKIVDKFGYEINDEMMKSFEKYYDEKLREMNEITSEKSSRTYKTAAEFLTDYNSTRIYNKEELNFFSEVRVTENYYLAAKYIDESYKDINIADIGEAGIAMYGLSGKAADTVRKQYEKLSDRFDRLKQNGEHRNLFFIGKAFRMHTLLFKTLFRNCIFEIMILVVLTTGHLLNYEFENKTQLVAYSTKRGRRLDLDKFFAAIFVSILAVTIIIGISLTVYFGVYDYSGLWGVPISSGFNREYSLPYISWWNMSFAKYLLSSIGLVYLCEILFAAITYIITRFIRNTYMVFFTFAVIFGLALVIPGFMPFDNNAIFVPQFTPFVLSTNSLLWFMEKGALAAFKYYELITVAAWSIFLIAACSICTIRFKKQSIY
jgi:hypothetical protein